MLRIHITYGPQGTRPSADDTFLPLHQSDLVLFRDALQVLDPDEEGDAFTRDYWIETLDALIAQTPDPEEDLDETDD